MSYILDALKKIDHEKNRKMSDGRINISGDLFQERKRPVINIGLWKIALLLVSVSLIASGVTLFVIRGSSGSKAAANPPQVPAPAVPVNVQSVPIPLTPDVFPKQNEMPVDTVNDESRSKKRIKRQTPSRKLPAQAVAAPADIILSGIAWQEERDGRRAVINGFLLKEGAVVSGAKITDILADRVYFSSSTGTFLIKLDAALPVEVKR